MKILANLHRYLPHQCSGGETTMHEIFKYLQHEGWDITVNYLDPKKNIAPYEYDGIKVIQQFKIRHDTYDIYFAHLDRLNYVFEKLKHLQSLNKMWVYQHNDHKYVALNQIGKAGGTITYNTQWVRDKNVYEYGYSDGVVVNPPVMFGNEPPENPEYITLINCNKNKGGDLLIEMAEKAPELNFMGVLGAYGKQVKKELPNLVYVDNNPNMQDVFNRTKVLICPSRYESFGKGALEANSYSIPVIHSKAHGFRESMNGLNTQAETLKPQDWLNAIYDVMDNYKDAANNANKNFCDMQIKTQEQLNELNKCLKEKL